MSTQDENVFVKLQSNESEKNKFIPSNVGNSNYINDDNDRIINKDNNNIKQLSVIPSNNTNINTVNEIKNDIKENRKTTPITVKESWASLQCNTFQKVMLLTFNNPAECYVQDYSSDQK